MCSLSSFPLFLAVLPIYLIECHLGKRNLSCKWNATLCFPPSTPPDHPHTCGGNQLSMWLVTECTLIVGTLFFFFTIICWFSKLEKKKIQVTSTCIDLHLKYVAPNCSNAGRSVSAWFLISPNDDGRPPYLILLFPHLCSDLWTHCGT